MKLAMMVGFTVFGGAIGAAITKAPGLFRVRRQMTRVFVDWDAAGAFLSITRPGGAC